MRVHRIAHDVAGEAYEHLLEAALQEAGTFSLVWQDHLQFDSSARAVRTALRGLQLRHIKSDRWPGTKLVGRSASVITYRATSSALDTLLKPGSLFAWRCPTYPEDLSFQTDEGAVCLATVSHEAQGWILSRTLAAAVADTVTLVPETLPAGDEQYFTGI